MKKINIVIMSMLTLILSGVLMACTFKKPEAEFSQEEIVLSVGETVDLDQYLSVKEIEKTDLSIVVAKADLFDVDGHKITAQQSGRSDVYAFYQKNILSSVSIVVRKAFEAPTHFEFSQKGVISWNVPVSYFENEKEPTTPQEYLIQGTRTVYSAENPDQIENVYNVNETVQTNSFALTDEGVYKLTVSAKECGYFSQSAQSAAQTFNFGYMEDVQLSWESETGILTWTQTENALYRVKLDGVLLDEKQEQNFKDLSSLIENKENGIHTLSVFVYDANGQKMTKESQSISIEKLAEPVVSYDFSAENGGAIKIQTSSNASAYKIFATNTQSGNVFEYDFENEGQDIKTVLPELEKGLYDIEIVALVDGENLFKSNLLTFGKVYKLDKLNVSGLGNNTNNNFNIKISSQESLFNTNVCAQSINCQVTGLQTGESEKNIALSVEQSGNFDVSLIQMPISRTNSVSEGNVYVLNSDSSEILNLTKVGEFEGQINHFYENEKSILSFSKVPYASNYELLYFNGTDYISVEAQCDIAENVEFVLSAKIEDLFEVVNIEGQQVYQFKIVAKTNDDDVAINSEKTKSIVLLSAPTSANSGNSTNKTYTWNASTNADYYALEIYTIDAETYNEHKDDENYTPSGSSLKVSTANNEYIFENVGYYYAKIYAISANENLYISSQTYMSEMFYIAEQLQLGDVVFGYDETFKNYSGFTQASGYFVKVENTENVDNFEIAVDDIANIFEIAGDDFSIYLFSETFAQAGRDYEVSVVAHAQDSTLYPNSEKETIMVSRLSPVTYNDMQIDKLTKTLTIKGKEGVSSILIWESDSNTASTLNEGEDAVFDISALSNFDLKFNLYGDKLADNVYSGNRIYLDSEQSTFNFSRLASPTDLRYYNGSLTMEHTATTATSYYVLDINCKTTTNTSYKLSVKFAQLVSVEYNGTEYPLGEKNDFISYSGTKITIDLAKIINLICLDETLGEIYNQAKEISFSAYAYQKSETSGRVTLSSFCATTYEDSTSTDLVVKKMASPEMEFSYTETDYTLSWDPIDANASVEAVTTYKIERNGEEFGSIEDYSLTATFSSSEFEIATFYDLCVTATNPNFLGEGVSNIVRIYRLRPITRLNLNNDGQLGFAVLDANYNSGVQVTTTSGSALNTTGKIDISESGAYTLKVVGKIVNNADAKVYYIDSTSSTWTLYNMASIKPSDTSLTLANNLLSWNAFGEGKGLGSLEYLVIFKDANGNFVRHSTTSTEVNLQNETTLFNSISTSLSAGDITISVSAHLTPYAVTSGGDIYYSQNVTLIDGTVENNHYLYEEHSSLKKLSTPEVTEVEFVHTDLADAQFPNIKISFVGNYGDIGRFTILLNDTVLKTLNINKTNDVYSFELTKEDYNNALLIGETMTVKVSAISSTDIPSSVGSVDIERAYTLKSLALAEEDGNFTQSLEVEFESDYLDSTVGGVVLEIVYDNGTGSQTAYELLSVDSVSERLSFDLSKFFKEKLKDGGTIKFSAYTNNFSDDENHYLACPEKKETQTYNVLKSVATVEKQAGGFVISDELNNDSTTYEIKYGANKFVVGKEDGFYFEVPDVWDNGTYNLKIQAKETGYVDSVITDIEFVLNRINKVSGVTMTRVADLSDVTLSWAAVSNASGYILRMYASDDTDKENLLYQFDATGNSYKLTEIFGNNYSSLLDIGEVTAFDLMSDMNVTFTLVAVGSDANNSKALEFNACIKGNSMTIDDLKLDDYSILTFDSEIGLSYLYRFVGADGSALSNWKQIDADTVTTTLDTSAVDTGTLFNVEIVKMGSISSTSSDYNFDLDSIALTTVGNDLTYILNDEIEKIGYNSAYDYEMVITATSNSFNKLFVGLDETAILDGNVVTVYPREIVGSNVGVQMNYAYSFADLLDAFESAEIPFNPKDTDTELYFWAYRETQDISGSYVVSKPYKFVLSFINENDFDSVTKIGQIEGGKFAEDYANTYVLFENKDVENALQTLGIYVKISQQEEEGYTITKFVQKDKLISQYFDGMFAINLTDLFEEEDLVDLSGNFAIAFAKLQLATETQKYILSNWLVSSNDSPFEFERLMAVTSLSLSAGNLYWQKQQEAGDRYYVYFADDLNDGKLSENYAYYVSTTTYFNASDFAGAEHTYYIAVRSLSLDIYQISSKFKFIEENSGEGFVPAKVYKNQITSPIVLKDGAISVAWDADGDFYKKLTSATANYATLADELVNTTFTSPFTFTIKNLVGNNLTLSMRFTSLNAGTEGVRQNFSINAKNLLSDLIAFGEENGFDIEERLNLLILNANSTETKSYLDKLLTLIKNGSHGIANKDILFDDYFDQLQLGGYKLEYCLLGNNTTLNSSWHSFKNANEENAFYVNEEPYVRVEKIESETDKSYNDYKVFVKKSNIYNYIDGEYLLEQANNYVIKIYDDVQMYVFAITKGIDAFSLRMLNDAQDRSVNVYECNSNGEELAGGDYLMFYINHNSGDSLLGVYGQEIEKLSFKMQVFAVGNDFSASSKSKFFNLTLLGFGKSLTVNKGVFLWTPQLNRSTTVIYRKSTSIGDGEVTVDGSLTTAKFSLDGLGDGLYNYIKFVVIGEIKDNTIYVDSEIYQIDNIYKLSSPTLSNEFGYIAIDDSANLSVLNGCYSDANPFNYILYNDVSTSGSYIDFTDDNMGTSKILYQPGTTGIVDQTTNDDYNYKSTEQDASQYMVSSVGTTAKIVAVEDETNYYIKKLHPVDLASGLASEKYVALRSNITTLNNVKYGIFDAKMLNATTGMKIENGILTWNENSGNTSVQDEILKVPATNGAKVVYKVTVVQYKLSASANGYNEDNVGVEYYYYTTNNQFDFAQIREDQIVDTTEVTYLKATVQALALYTSDIMPSGDYVEFVEGGYGYGKLNYVKEDGTTTSVAIIMSEGEIKKQIDRLEPIKDNSLKVVNGKIQWKYTTEFGMTKDTLLNQYSFVVVDADGKQIDGTFDVSAPETNLTNLDFTITFTEKKGELKSGTQTLKVYATQGSQNNDVVIKSFAREIEITKLKTVQAGDQIITSDSQTETLDLSNFFADSNSNIVTMTVEFLGTDRTETFTFDKTHYKLYLLREENDELTYPNGYLSGYIVIGDQQIIKLSFKVTNDSIENCLYSDISDDFMLQRSDWGENGNITWNEQTQQFEWVYNGYNSLQETTTSISVSKSNLTTNEVSLYLDSELIELSEYTLPEGTQIEILEESETYTKISYSNGEYFINKSDYQEVFVDGENETLNVGVMFKVVESKDDTSIICTVDGEYYKIASSKIVAPIYIVEVVYGEGESAVNRIYTTSDNFFKPTVIGKVGISVRIKLGNSNIQSEKLTFNDGGKVDFNLFESGDGTNLNPYKIASIEQFKNIAKRQTKDTALVQYVENTSAITENNQFYFELATNIVLSDESDESTFLSGVLFKGNFDGIIDGKNYTVSYIANNTSVLETPIPVSVGNVLGAENETSTTYRYGVALFEYLTSMSKISNLNLDVTYRSSGTIPNNSLMAGLTIKNSGRIENVNLTGFSSNFVGYSLPGKRVIMVYSGIASINLGSSANITDCHVLTNMDISDYNQSQLIFVSGIVFTNYATIANCTFGNESTSVSLSVVCQETSDTVQIAGIAVTNTSGATISNCTNYANIKVECTKSATSNVVTVYMAGIADLGAGTMSSNTNSGTLEHNNINLSNLYYGEIYAKNK
ncbi:MAG: hypothetical protein ACI4R8_05080 [Candidatus Caccovivens sp.]